MQRGRDAAPVEEKDPLAAVLREPAELGEKRRRERIARLLAQVDDANRGHRRCDPAAELEPLERVPGLGPRRRRAEDRDRSLEGGPLGGDGAGVVAGVRLLLVRGVVLLVDADHAERRERREHGRAGADDDGRLAADDPLPFVPPLGLREAGVEQRDPVSEARAEAAERLRRQRDLRHEHDRAAARGEGGLAGADVDLGLAAAGRAGEEDVSAAAREQALDPLERALPASPKAGPAAARRPGPPSPSPPAARRAASAAAARSARARGPVSSRSSPRARERDRRAPAAASRAPALPRRARRRAALRRRRRRPHRGDGRCRRGSRGRLPSPPRPRSRR